MIKQFFLQYKIYILAIALSGLIATTFAFGVRHANLACEAEKLEELNKLIEEKNEVDLRLHEASVILEKLRNEKKPQEFKKRIEHEITIDDSYKRVIADDGLRILAEAVTLTNSR